MTEQDKDKLFPAVAIGNWSEIEIVWANPDSVFVDDMWHQFRPHIDGIMDAAQKEFADLIQVVSQFYLRIDSDDIFGPKFVMDGKRSPIPSDLSDHALEILAQVFESCPHQDLQARIGDVVWLTGRHVASLKRRRFEIAKSTLGVYQKVAEHALSCIDTQPTHWVPGRDRLRRAAQIVREINQPDATKCLVEWVVNTISQRKASESSYTCRDLLEISLDFGFTKAADVASESLEIAERLHLQRLYSIAEIYYGLAQRSTAKLQDAELLKNRHGDCAKNHIAIAVEYLTASPDAWAPAERHYSLALNHHKNAGAGKNITDPIQAEILRLNQLGVKSCGTISVPFDLSEWNTHLDQEFRDAELSESIFKFLFRLHIPQPYQYYRDELNRAIKEHPMLMRFPMSRMSHDGRVEAVADGAMGADQEKFGGRLFYEVGHRQGITGIQLNAARRVLLDHCPIDLATCEQFAIDSPYVGADRYRSVGLAIWRGWQGRWLEAIHLLIPQLEHVIRVVLTTHKVVITKPNPTQHDYIDLGGLLSDHENILAQIIGEGEALALRAACTERIAINRRNDLAHGLIPDNDFGTPSDVYLWWLFQRIICSPMFFSNSD